MNRSRLPYIFLALAFLITLSAVIFFIRHRSKPVATVLEKPPVVKSEPPPVENPPPVAQPILPKPTGLQDIGPGAKYIESGKLVRDIAAAFSAGNFSEVTRLIGKDAWDEATFRKLQELTTGRKIQVGENGGVREIGEIELGELSRWVIDFQDEQTGHLILDLRRKEAKWSVEKLKLTTDLSAQSEVSETESIAVADRFLQAVMKQDFAKAVKLVDGQNVTNAKIAALCILFEEGEYRLRKTKPLRAIFQKQNTTGYLAHVETTDGKLSAQFALTLTQAQGQQATGQTSWIISEINLDQLLADYAKRVGGGDIYFSPLVKNPQGGETLAIYFEYDEAGIGRRTVRQLEIVAEILKTDTRKKLTLSGHTDAKGTDEYNNGLSEKRAEAVRDFLAQRGVAKEQIVTIAKGASQPRRPNVTQTGQDDPEGRRVNRRTEIYLDF